MWCTRNSARTTLLKRFRSTARGRIFLLAIIPSLACPLLLRTKKILKCLSEILSALRTRLKPFSRSNLYAAENLAGVRIPLVVAGIDIKQRTPRGQCVSTAGQVKQQVRLNSKSGATARAAGINHSTATACFHAHQKTMGAFSAGYGGLVGAFHVYILRKCSKIVKLAITKPHGIRCQV